jgi:beta-glucosidase
MPLNSQPSTLNGAQGLSFLWGVASSGYQSEGGFNGPGQPCNNWAEAERSGRVQATGVASDFWTRYEEDFERCRAMGLNAFRLGIEWARVQPVRECEPGDPPPFDDAAIDAYADRIAACRRYGLEPVVTLHHFTHPAWLGLGAWLNDATVGHFGDYVGHVVRQINQRLVEVHQTDPVRIFITVNEPNILIQNTCLVPHFPGAGRGWPCAVAKLNHLLAAHIRAYNRIHDCYVEHGWPTPRVSLNTFCSELYWADQIIWD